MKFTPLEASAVRIGRGLRADLSRGPYREAVAASDAGVIQLDAVEKGSTCRRLLAEAAKELKIPIRATYVASEHAIYWKRTAAALAETATPPEPISE